MSRLRPRGGASSDRNPEGDRALVGILVLFIMIGLAALYMVVATSVLGGLGNSPVVQDDSFSDPDAMINASSWWERSKDIAFIYVPVIMIASGLVFAVGYYVRRERAGGRRPPPI